MIYLKLFRSPYCSPYVNLHSSPEPVPPSVVLAAFGGRILQSVLGKFMMDLN